MSRKKAKKAVKKIVVAEVQRVPSAFDDDFFAEPSQKGFSSWPFLRFNFHEHCTLGSENEFVDIDSFSDVVVEVVKEVETSVAAAAVETVDPHPLVTKTRPLPNSRKSLK
jgi:hypothetical protein